MLKLCHFSSLSISLASIKTEQNGAVLHLKVSSQLSVCACPGADLRLSLRKLLTANEPQQGDLWRPEAEVPAAPFAPLINWQKVTLVNYIRGSEARRAASILLLWTLL